MTAIKLLAMTIDLNVWYSITHDIYGLGLCLTHKKQTNMELANGLICTKLSMQSGGTIKIGEFQRWVFLSLVPQLYQQEYHQS